MSFSTTIQRAEATPLRRHALVWLSQSPQPGLEQDAQAVDRWQAEGRPFVVCRQRGNPDGLSLGFCTTSPGARPRRIAVQAGPDQILHVSRPPALADLAAAKPEMFAPLSMAALGARFDVRVFGSWMWQLLTGDPHAGAASDLDVLVEVSTMAEADRAAAWLQQQAAGCPFKLDGELSFPELGEIHWREYLSGEPSLLLKSLHDVRLIRREEL